MGAEVTHAESFGLSTSSSSLEKLYLTSGTSLRPGHYGYGQFTIDRPQYCWVLTCSNIGVSNLLHIFR